jgi:hypothetical protein
MMQGFLICMRVRPKAEIARFFANLTSLSNEILRNFFQYPQLAKL